MKSTFVLAFGELLKYSSISDSIDMKSFTLIKLQLVRGKK